MMSNKNNINTTNEIDILEVEPKEIIPPIVPTTPSSSLLDLEQFRVSQSFAQAGIKKVITTIPVTKPNKQQFVRVKPGAENRYETMIIEDNDDKTAYLLHPDIFFEVADVAVSKVLLTSITKQGIPFLWSIRMHDQDGKLDHWNASAHEAAVLAEKNWVRLSANRALGAYDIFIAENNDEHPVWPDLSLQQIISIAFKDKIIDSVDHPLIRKLKGR